VLPWVNDLVALDPFALAIFLATFRAALDPFADLEPLAVALDSFVADDANALV